jgi:hypothetical protein
MRRFRPLHQKRVEVFFVEYRQARAIFDQQSVLARPPSGRNSARRAGALLLDRTPGAEARRAGCACRVLACFACSRAFCGTRTARTPAPEVRWAPCGTGGCLPGPAAGRNRMPRALSGQGSSKALQARRERLELPRGSPRFNPSQRSTENRRSEVRILSGALRKAQLSLGLLVLELGQPEMRDPVATPTDRRTRSTSTRRRLLYPYGLRLRERMPPRRLISPLW